MSDHSVNIDEHWWSVLRRQIKTCEVRFDDRDYQTGDRIRFYSVYWSDWFEITHVLKNFAGVKDGFVVLSLKHPDDTFIYEQRNQLSAEVDRLTRSNAALRGHITKLRKRIGGDA